MGTFAWASQVSHGSILALRELARETENATSDLLLRATDDDKGNVLLYHACWLILWFAASLHDECGAPIPGYEMLSNRINAANERLNIVSPQQTADISRIREEYLRKRQGVSSEEA